VHFLGKNFGKQACGILSPAELRIPHNFTAYIIQQGLNESNVMLEKAGVLSEPAVVLHVQVWANQLSSLFVNQGYLGDVPTAIRCLALMESMVSA
jgi:hypothetical protein